MKRPNSVSTVSLHAWSVWVQSGCKGVAGLAPTHLQVLGELGVERGEGGREKRRKAGREGERERRTVGVSVSRVQTISRLSFLRISGCWAEPLSLLWGVGAVGCHTVWLWAS